MKNKLFLQSSVIMITGIMFMTSCKREKEFKQLPFKFQSTTWYRIAPSHPTPIEVNGTTYVGFANFPGGCEGNATHLGKYNTFFNQLAYATSPEAPPAGSVSAAATDIPGYP